MRLAPPGSFGAHLKSLREAAGFTQEELAAIAGLSVHAVGALERGERQRPQFETVRSLSMALDLTGTARDALIASARKSVKAKPGEELNAPPLPLTALVGRAEDVVVLRQWLTDSTIRLITLIGPGGVGKTRLALELARATADEGKTRVVFVSLAAIREVAFVASAIAEALGVGDVSPRELPGRARAACEGHTTLLVLDNFEQVLAAATLVADLTTVVPALGILVTSRAPLHVRGEREYPLSALALGPESETLPPEVHGRSPAVQLFVDRLRDVQSDFQLTASNASIVAAICRKLDSLPLALELAAPWIKVLTLDGLLKKLERDVLLSSTSARDLPERQQTMNATVAWSYQLLDEAGRPAFRRFGALPGLFPIDAAAEVLAGRERASDESLDAFEAVAALMDKSLLSRSESSVVTTCPLYYMLETVRAYAGVELAAARERDDAMEGLVRYCTAEAALAADGLIGPTQLEWLDRVREDLDSYRAGLGWLIERGRAAEASDIAWALLFFWLIRGHATEGLRWYEQILNLPSLPSAAAARARLGAAAMLHTHGAFDQARAHLTAAIDIVHQSDDAEVIPQAAWMFGHIEYAAGNLLAARDWFTQSRAGFRALPSVWGAGSASNGLAWVALASGHGDEADRLVNEATVALRSAGPWFLALGLYVRVVLTLQQGNPDAAAALMRQSLTRVRESQDKFGIVYGLVALAAAAALKGDDAWVARILGARDAIRERAGSSLIDPMLRELGERTERESRSRLGPDRWAHAYAEGRKASIDSMLEDIDRAIGRPYRWNKCLCDRVVITEGNSAHGLGGFMTFAKYVFTGAGVWGIVVLTPLFWLVDVTGRHYPSPTEYPHFFYGFLSVAMAWQIAFLFIGSNPLRFRWLMIPSIIEKLGYVSMLLIFYSRGRIPAIDAQPAWPDMLLGILFIVAFVKTRA